MNRNQTRTASKKRKPKVNGDTIMFLVSLITANHNVELKPENIEIVMGKMPTNMRDNKEVRKLVTAIMNG